ncbi:hypothetical protein [Cognatilysobacter terrigena]|uniref:hypothetical protein n=1 Tax=Cognatilysobacter terrigena TaxID=2488749 RepID=UPI001FE7251E|nr:hypothetical protein [Lysobacter terrigena]
MALRRLASLMLVALLSFAAIAGERYVAIEKRLTPEELASIGLTPEQLQRLNTVLRDAAARDTASAPTPRRDVSVSNDATPSPKQHVGLDSEAMTAKVRGRVDGWSLGTVFDLDNGQQWTVLKGTVKLNRAIDSPTVRLVPGIAGRWFLELDEDHPKARVYRSD